METEKFYAYYPVQIEAAEGESLPDVKLYGHIACKKEDLVTVQEELKKITDNAISKEGREILIKQLEVKYGH
jgi:hypothetical protein